MARLQRVSPPPRGIGNPTTYRYLSDLADAINGIPNFSIESSLTDLNTSGITTNSGVFGFDVGSSATTFYMKESDGTQGWSSIASHGYVEGYTDDRTAYAHLYLDDSAAVQTLSTTSSQYTPWEEGEKGPEHNMSSSTTMACIFVESAGTYLVMQSSQITGDANTNYRSHLAKNGVSQGLGWHRTAGSAAALESAVFQSIITAASGDSLSCIGWSDDAGGAPLHTIDASFTAIKLS